MTLQYKNVSVSYDEDDGEKEEEVENENSKNIARLLFIIDNAAFIVVGVGLLAVSLVFLIMFRSFSILFLATALAGVASVLVANIGFCGSQYGKKDKESKLKYLVAHFAVVFMLALFVTLFAGLCFFFKDFGMSLIILTWKNYKKYFEKELDGFDFSDEIGKYLQNYYVVGAIAAFLLLVIIIGLILGAYLLGIIKFIKFILFIGAFSIICIGLLCIVIGTYFVSVYRFAEGSRGLTVAVILMGAVIILLGAFGIYVGLNFEEKRCFLLIYLIILLLYLIAFVCIGGVFYILASSTESEIEDDVMKWCTNIEGKKEEEAIEITDGFCQKIQKNIMEAYHCTMSEPAPQPSNAASQFGKAVSRSSEALRRVIRKTMQQSRRMTGDAEPVDVCSDAQSVLTFLVVFIQEYFRMIGYACVVFGAFILVNIVLVLICIVNPFSTGEKDGDDDDSDDESSSYVKTIQEKDHKNDMGFGKKSLKIYPTQND